MRSIFLLSATAMMAAGMNAATLQLSLEELNTKWGDGTVYDPATKTITFTESWKGCGWWLANADYSEYDKLVVEFEPTDVNVKAAVEYNGGVTASSATVNPGAEKVECQLDPEGKADVKQIYLQTNNPGNIVLKAAYLTNNEPPVEMEKTDLPLDNLTTGWGCTYDPETQTINYDEGPWKGKGWWLEDVDYSEYQKVVVEFEPVDFGVQLVVEYVDKSVESTKSMVNAGSDIVECEFNKKGAANVMQIYIQNSAVGSLTLKAAYLAKPKDNGVQDIADEKLDINAPAEYFTIQGVRVDNPSKGLYIRRQGNKITKVIL